MPNSNELSEGSLEEYVCQGKHPPKNENIFQVKFFYVCKKFISNGLSFTPYELFCRLRYRLFYTGVGYKTG